MSVERVVMIRRMPMKYSRHPWQRPIGPRRYARSRQERVLSSSPTDSCSGVRPVGWSWTPGGPAARDERRSDPIARMAIPHDGSPSTWRGFDSLARRDNNAPRISADYPVRVLRYCNGTFSVVTQREAWDAKYRSSGPALCRVAASGLLRFPYPSTWWESGSECYRLVLSWPWTGTSSRHRLSYALLRTNS